MLALPPIHDPERAPKPDQRSAPTMPLKRKNTKGIPIIIPRLPAIITIRAFFPRRVMAFMSEDSRRRTKLGGSRLADILEYIPFPGSRNPEAEATIGQKYIQNTGGMILKYFFNDLLLET
jgi:hypothetical protein